MSLDLLPVVLGVLLLAAAGAAAEPKTYADWSQFKPGNFDPAHTVTLTAGDIRVVVGDATPHGGCDRPSYEGLHHLSHRLRDANVFCPLYAGMIGVRRECRLTRLGDNGAVIAIGEGKHLVREEFVVRPPHYLDYTMRETAGAATVWWNNTSYMNGPADPGIHVLTPTGAWVRHYSERHGDRASVAPATMAALPPVTKTEQVLYPHGNSLFWEGFSDLRFDPKYPLFYGRFDDFVLIFMVERKYGNDLISYMSPSGGGFSQEFNRPNPAWDHRLWLRNLTPGAEIVIRQRLVYKPFVSNEDVLREYEVWQQGLEGG